LRTAFIEALFDLAAEDERVHLVVGDLGFSVIEKFAAAYPKRFVNAGVAEQNMTGLAAGIALSGGVVFTYSIANFATLRCLEQIRNDVCYHRANVKVVSVGGGLAYGNLGVTHHASEDLAIMRALPGMVVVAPGDPVEAGLATRALVAHEGPAFLRLGKAGEAVVHSSRPDFRLGRAILVRPGNDLAILSTGGMLATAVKVSDRLAARGVSARVLSVHTVSPLDLAAVRDAAETTRLVVTLEEHSLVGGLGGAVAEVLAELPRGHAPLQRLGLPHQFTSIVGDQAYLRALHGLDEEAVFKKLEMILEKSVGSIG
jgi:transketolase